MFLLLVYLLAPTTLGVLAIIYLLALLSPVILVTAPLWLLALLMWGVVAVLKSQRRAQERWDQDRERRSSGGRSTTPPIRRQRLGEPNFDIPYHDPSWNAFMRSNRD